MEAVANDALAEAIEAIDGAWNGSTPDCSEYFSPEGDCLFFYNEDAPYYRERVDNLLTVFRAVKGGRIMGLQVKGISDLPNHSALGVDVTTKDKLPRFDLVNIVLFSYGQAVAKGGDAKRDLREPYAEIIHAFSYQCGPQALDEQRVAQ